MSADPNLKPLGRIVRLQIQLKSPITGERPNRVYNPTPDALVPVNEMTLTSQGASIRKADGEPVLDIHHAQHPHTLNDENTNALSVNFTSHYEMIKTEYGGHLWMGCAGENIVVETIKRIHLDTVASGLAIQPKRGGELIWLREVSVAHPCRPFSGYVLGGTEANTKETLQFLDKGIRGYYCALIQEQPVTIAIGDLVYVAQP